MKLFFGAGETATWISESFPIIRIVLISIMALCGILMIFTTMMQPSSQDGSLGAIGGSSDTYFSKNKEKTLEGTMKRLTIILACIMFVVAVLFFISYNLYNAGI